MTDDKNTKNGFDIGVGDALFDIDIYDKSKTYVRITEDDKQAWLYLMPKEDGNGYTKDELLGILHEHDVVAGINEDNLTVFIS